MPTIRVDGNDLFACYGAAKEALQRARAGEGPSFIEALTYRLGDHTTADDARRYRPAAELEAAVPLDPIVRTRKYLESKGLWDEAQQKKATQKAKAIVHDVIAVAEGIEKPTADQMFDYMFAELPDELQREKQSLRTDSIGQDPTQIGLQLPEDRQVERTR